MGLLNRLRSLLPSKRRDWSSIGEVERFGETPQVAHLLSEWLTHAETVAPVQALREAQPFLLDSEHASDADFAALAHLLARTLSRISDDDLALVDVEHRVRAWLAASLLREELAQFVVDRAFCAAHVPTYVVAGEIRADYSRWLAAQPPARVVTFSEAQSPLELRIRRIRSAGARLEIELIAVVRVLDFAHYPTTFALRHQGQVLEHQVLRDPAATRFSARRWQSHDDGSLGFSIADDGGDVVVELEVAGLRRRAVLSEKRIAARLPKPVTGPAATGVRVDGDTLIVDGVDVRLPLTHSPFGLAPRPVPPGLLTLPEPIAVSEEFAGRLPIEVAAAHHIVEVTSEKGALKLRLLAQLSDAERGRFHQQRLQELRPVIDPNLVLFVTYAGKSVTDSPLAIHHELRRRRPELRLVWAVEGPHVLPPEGGQPLLQQSTACHQAWASAGMIVTNTEVPRSFTPRPEQLVVETFHGYPAKSMGKMLWQSKNFSPRKVEYQLDRTSRLWSLALTPHPSMDRHYLEQYDVTGTIVNVGYPRNDDLVGERASELRRTTRERLGIAEHQRVVLYAPTWRDNQAVDFRKAARATYLQAEKVLASDPNTVVLLRGHRFNDAGTSAERAIDVTDYPEINDLILAADVAVLDYSSLRFDFAITGKPMIFLVPDLDDYTSNARGFLFPFTESAPGPLVESTEEVCALLADFDELRSSTAAQIAEFNERYNSLHDGAAAQRVTDVIIERMQRR